MAFLDGWLDEPDEAIGRFAKAFYVLTYLFIAVLAVQLSYLAWHGGDVLHAGDVIAPLVNLFLALSMYALALDGRRARKAMMAKGSS